METRDSLIRHVGVEPMGDVPATRKRRDVISVERRLKHPTTVAITVSARADLFGH
jgi:hypothetical protein